MSPAFSLSKPDKFIGFGEEFPVDSPLTGLKLGFGFFFINFADLSIAGIRHPKVFHFMIPGS